VNSINHETIPVQVWADIDIGIADDVRWLNSLPGVRTFASCQGTMGEGGPLPYGAYVKCWWPPEHDTAIRARFHIVVEGNGWRDVRPRQLTTSTHRGLGSGPIPPSLTTEKES
jgi:hypothetical protein